MTFYPSFFFMPFVVKSITLFWKILWIKLYSSDDWEKKQKPKFHMKRTIRYHQNMMYKMFKIQLLNMEVSSESNPMCLISKYELCLQSIWRQQKSDSNRSKDRNIQWFWGLVFETSSKIFMVLASKISCIFSMHT